MAKKQVPAERTSNQKTPKSQNKNKTKEKNPASLGAKSKNKSRNKGPKAAAGDASSEGNIVLAMPSSRKEFENNGVAESGEAAEDRVGDKEGKKKPKGKGEQKKKPKGKSGKETSGEEEAKSKGKKRSKKEEGDVESDVEEEKSENALYRFPMNRVSRIIRSENQDYRISQEAVFLINKASEKFLQVFCKEAYACTFLEDKRYTAYNHLSSVVAKRKRFGFLSDFVPEKVKAEDALAQLPAADK